MDCIMVHMSQSTSVKTEPPEMLGLAQVVQMLRVSGKTGWRLVNKGVFPGAFKAGRDWRIPASDVDAYIAARRVRPPAPQAEGGA
jgi:excisionase family DNA binding protein